MSDDTLELARALYARKAWADADAALASADGVVFTVPGFHVAGVEIWGATAMVLSEFLALLGWLGPATG